MIETRDFPKCPVLVGNHGKGCKTLPGRMNKSTGSLTSITAPNHSFR
jgi:hypothetical protein